MGTIEKNSKEFGEASRLVHKDVFDRTKKAIENGFYLEAIFIEYAAMESRVLVLLKVLGLPCGTDEITNVGIYSKMQCLKSFTTNETLFGKTYLDKTFFRKTTEFINSRNFRIHALFSDPLKYNKQRNNDEKVAKSGYEIINTLYKEANRLKGLKKRRPELFAENKCECLPLRDDCERYLKGLSD